MDEIVLPTVRAMKAQGAPFRGVLYAGLMLTADGPKLIEYNVRFGDPECQVLMLRLMSDLVPALIACSDGMLKNFDLRWYPDAALDGGDGRQGLSGRLCQGLGDRGPGGAAAVEGVQIFHAGTQAEAAASSPTAAACSTSRRSARRCARRTRAPTRRSTDPLAGRLLPPRHRLPGGGAGERADMADLADLFPRFHVGVGSTRR